MELNENLEISIGTPTSFHVGIFLYELIFKRFTHEHTSHATLITHEWGHQRGNAQVSLRAVTGNRTQDEGVQE